MEYERIDLVANTSDGQLSLLIGKIRYEYTISNDFIRKSLVNQINSGKYNTNSIIQTLEPYRNKAEDFIYDPNLKIGNYKKEGDKMRYVKEKDLEESKTFLTDRDMFLPKELLNLANELYDSYSYSELLKLRKSLEKTRLKTIDLKVLPYLEEVLKYHHIFDASELDRANTAAISWYTDEMFPQEGDYWEIEKLKNRR